MSKAEKAERDLGAKRFNHELKTRGVDGFIDWQKDLQKKKHQESEAGRQRRMKASLDEFNSATGAKIAVGTYNVSQDEWDRIFKKGASHA